jgi:hypothetical protein
MIAFFSSARRRPASRILRNVITCTGILLTLALEHKCLDYCYLQILYRAENT